MDGELEKLLLPIAGFEDVQLERIGEQWYTKYCVEPGRAGEILTRDAENVYFYPDKYHHAFHTSPDRARQAYSKAKLARDRIERMRWIRALIAGELPNSECWLVPPDGQRFFPRKLLFILWSEFYVVWLEPKANRRGHNFTTAYVTDRRHIMRYLERGSRQWTIGAEKKSP